MMYNGDMMREHPQFRKSQKTVWVGSVPVGGVHPVSVQSMTNTKTADSDATLAQIEALMEAGCQIVRVGIPSKREIDSFGLICQRSPMPVIADIHFHAELALAAMDAGAQGIRINPGNIRDEAKLKRVVMAAGKAGIPIRIGVNSGSLPQRIRTGYPDRAEGMVQLALETVKRFEDWGFDQIKISLKSSDIETTVRANRLLAQSSPYPVHLGITEAGDAERGIIASAIGIGALLLDGIGDTVRVSLTGDPVQEVIAAVKILDLLGMGGRKVADIFACPTCARTQVDLLPLVQMVRERLKGIPLQRHIRVAIMGCEVNGPGEASEADLGLAFSGEAAYLFVSGAKVARFRVDEAVEGLVAWVQKEFALGVSIKGE